MLFIFLGIMRFDGAVHLYHHSLHSLLNLNGLHRHVSSSLPLFSPLQVRLTSHVSVCLLFSSRFHDVHCRFALLLHCAWIGLVFSQYPVFLFFHLHSRVIFFDRR